MWTCFQHILDTKAHYPQAVIWIKRAQRSPVRVCDEVKSWSGSGSRSTVLTLHSWCPLRLSVLTFTHRPPFLPWEPRAFLLALATIIYLSQVVHLLVDDVSCFFAMTTGSPGRPLLLVALCPRFSNPSVLISDPSILFPKMPWKYWIHTDQVARSSEHVFVKYKMF